MRDRAVVIGGSIGGLFAAAMLQRTGWDVHVYERTPVELAGRGAGIVTHEPLLEALEICGAGTRDLGVTIEFRTAYDLDGNVIRRFEFPQLVTSWDRLHALTRATIPNERYHLGHVLERFEESAGGVRAKFTNGHVAEADLLVGADGFRSAVRGQLFPEIQPEYAGYITWRGVAEEAALPANVRDNAFEYFGFFLPRDGEVLGYPIAGAENCLVSGKRRYNWVWYRVVDKDALTDMLTDENGTEHEMSIAPPLIRKDVTQRMRDDAHSQLALPFREILEQIKAPFFTPIYDLASPAMAQGQVAMVGDAAFVARPHIGAGVTKAAEDARSLAEALEAADTLDEGLAAFNSDRLDKNRIAYQRAQYLGEYLVPRCTNEAEYAEWAAHHNLATIMRDTAVLNFY